MIRLRYNVNEGEASGRTPEFLFNLNIIQTFKKL